MTTSRKSTCCDRALLVVIALGCRGGCFFERCLSAQRQRADQFSLRFEKLLQSSLLQRFARTLALVVFGLFLLLLVQLHESSVLDFLVQNVLEYRFFLVDPTIRSNITKICNFLYSKLFTFRVVYLYYVITGFLHGCKLSEQQSKSF